MRQVDEPLIGPEFPVSPQSAQEEPAVVDRIRELVEGEPFAVLCTQGEGQPYGSVVAFAFAPDLASFVFATAAATRKYRLLCENDRVALVVDDRGRFPGELMQVSAVTITGRANPVEPGPESERWAGLLTSRHPYLKRFVASPSTVLFRVRVTRCLHVTRFQEVRQWTPTRAG
jgi:nitroimidazol reductase NimA-like FMN-containing flavoprotein (pyridoxamine 5'-phosphate oxidase superfamily)